MSTINEIFETASKKMSENLNITLHTSHELANIVAQVGAFKDRTNELNSEIVDEIVYDLFVALQLSNRLVRDRNFCYWHRSYHDC